MITSGTPGANIDEASGISKVRKDRMPMLDHFLPADLQYGQHFANSNGFDQNDVLSIYAPVLWILRILRTIPIDDIRIGFFLLLFRSVSLGLPFL